MQKNKNKQLIFLGTTQLPVTDKVVSGEYVKLGGELYYKIQNYDAMEPFFMSIVSSSDHWLFISSTGGLTAGRISPEHSLFPYYTDDKITENNGNTGNKAILLVGLRNKTCLWEPFSMPADGNYHIQRNIYKNIPGTALVFEEINQDIDLSYRYAWRTGEKFGFIKTTWLVNSGRSACRVDFIDGLQNILPAGITSLTQNTFSPLLDAYKRSELDAGTGLAIFSLNSNLTDLAEPSESLIATSIAQAGLEKPGYLLSSDQLDRFRQGNGVVTENDIRGRRAAYFIHDQIELEPGAERSWHLFADVDQDGVAIVNKISLLHGSASVLVNEIERDIRENDSNLRKFVAGADGLQLSEAQLCNSNHFSNVMFNIMRGGLFAGQYWINKNDYLGFVTARNREVVNKSSAFSAALPDRFSVSDLLLAVKENGTPDLVRLSYSYLPLTFSRRHGDPSRPWNQFATRIKNPDGSTRLDYEGNWRDIFQNWEALAYSYPEFVESMICTFLGATTVDGYNPYRITYQGIDWEQPQPGNPWANLGYWSDHQVIYLQKLMEISTRLHPGRLQRFLDHPLFSYADIPYKIKPYDDLLKDPNNTITFDWDRQRLIEARMVETGTDGKLVRSQDGQVLQVSLAEKLLTLLLAKLANFVPEGGIWMNTQRPEWNDANNALVGKGLSVVTLCYLHRYITFCRQLFSESKIDSVALNPGIQIFFERVFETLDKFKPNLKNSFTDEERRMVMDALGQAGSDYRWDYYKNGFAGDLTQLPVSRIVEFLDLVLGYTEHSLRANKRTDNLFHSYNVIHLDSSRASISHLYEMLEGQVAILSSGLLSSEESLLLLEDLRHSALYQPGQNTYILYPDRNIPGFLKKNCLSPEMVAALGLFSALVEQGETSLVIKDMNGDYHFSGQIRNIRDINRTLELLKNNPRYKKLVEVESNKIRELFESTFHHNEFTGRSGTFFAYEGLGSVYWHMVAKLLLAVQETVLRDRHGACTNSLVEKYHDIRAGFSFTKSPAEYGAFPTDPYSHTPKGHGAKQPGMTGLVKEEILTRQAELGLRIEQGRLVFDPLLLDTRELLASPDVYTYLDVNGKTQSLQLDAGSLVYTICQTPVVLKRTGKPSITVLFSDGHTQHFEGNGLDVENSRHIFERDGVLNYLIVNTPIHENRPKNSE
jgi:hypothetical protein